MTIAIQFIAGFITFSIGVGFGMVLKGWLNHRRSYSGIIYITTEEGRTLYSLELHENPAELNFVDEVIFKVDSSGLSFNRN